MADTDADHAPEEFNDDLFPNWDDLALEGLMVVTDNGGETMDRYSAVFRDGDVLGFSTDPAMPNRFSQWGGEDVRHSEIHGWIERGDTIVTDHPDWMRQHLLARINESYRDGIKTGLQAGNNIDDIRADIISEEFDRPEFEHEQMAPKP